MPPHRVAIGIHEKKYIKPLKQCLVLSKYSINGIYGYYHQINYQILLILLPQCLSHLSNSLHSACHHLSWNLSIHVAHNMQMSKGATRHIPQPPFTTLPCLFYHDKKLSCLLVCLLVHCFSLLKQNSLRVRTPLVLFLSVCSASDI